MAIPLKKVVDADRWDAEGLVGRLGIVAHAGFLDAGFLPYGAKPISGPLLKRVRGTVSSLSRRYTASQLVYRKDAEAAELKLSSQGSDVVFHAYLTKGGADRWSAYREHLDAAALAPLLSRGLDDTALALRTVAAGAWLWKALADGLCRDLLLDLCRRNSVPVEPSFTSLPADVKVAILQRLTDGDDLARVECTSKEMRCLVNEHDEELWKAMYEAWGARRRRPLRSAAVGQPSPTSWKDRYVNARHSSQCDSWFPYPFLISPTERYWNFDDDADANARLYSTLLSELRELRWIDTLEEQMIQQTDSYPGAWWCDTFPGAWWCHDPPERETVVARDKKETTRGQRPRVVWNDDRKRHGGAGAIHSPSSRYRWKHR